MANGGEISRSTGSKAASLLLLCSTLVALWFAIFGGFTLYGDAGGFFHNAAQLVQLHHGHKSFSSGYPILIALTGVPMTGSIVPLLIVQVAFAALTPWLAFRAFAASDWRIGIVAGIVCLASLTPFFFQNMFYHDGPSLFFGFLSITLASIFFSLRRPRYIYLSLASATFAYFIRPGMVGFVIGCASAFALFALLKRRHLTHVVAAFGLVVAWIAIASAAQQWSLRRDGGSPAAAEQLGWRLFNNIYIQGATYAKFEGPAADELRRELLRVFTSPAIRKEFAHNERFKNSNHDLYGEYQGREEELVERILAHPSTAYLNVLGTLGGAHGGLPDRALLRASLEFLYRHPVVALGFVSGNALDFAIGMPWSCENNALTYPACRRPAGVTFYPSIENVAAQAGNVPETARGFLAARVPSRGALASAFDGAWRWIYFNLRTILLVSMLAGWIASFWGARELNWTLTTFVMAYVANILVFSLVVAPEYRYQIPGMAMTAFAAGPGIYALMAWLFRLAVPTGRRASSKGSRAVAMASPLQE